MYSTLSALLLAAAASSDSFIIGLNYGSRGVRIPPVSNALAACICFGGTLASMLAGRAASDIFAPAAGNLISGGVLALAGVWMLLSGLFSGGQPLHRYSEHPEHVDKNRSSVIEAREAVLAGAVLSLNNVGLGLGGGLAGIPVLLTPLACGLFSFFFILAGSRLGCRIANSRTSRRLELVSAGLILFLGLRQLLH